MTTQRFSATIAAAVLGFAVFIGGPTALVGGSTSAAMAWSGKPEVMGMYGISRSTTLSQAQIQARIERVLANSSANGGLTGVANLIAALVTTVGVSRGGDAQASNLSAMLTQIAANNPSLSGAIAGGLSSGATALGDAWFHRRRGYAASRSHHRYHHSDDRSGCRRCSRRSALPRPELLRGKLQLA